MSKDKPPPLPYARFSFEDFFNDPSVVKMSNEEIGAYMKLLRVCWSATSPGHLPDDDDYLAVVSGMGSLWPAHRSAMANAFKIKHGKWIQNRVVREYEHCRGLSEARSKAGKAGADLLWHGHGSAMAKDGRVRVRGRVRETERVEEESSQHPLLDAIAPSGAWDVKFEEWWKVYRRGSKQAALKNWRKVKPRGDDTFKAIMDGTERYMAECLRIDRKLKDGQGFLTNRLWDGFEAGSEDHEDPFAVVARRTKELEAAK